MKKYTFPFKGTDIEIIYPEELEKDVMGQVNELYKHEVYKLGIKKNAVYLDVGANVGLATKYFYPYAKKIYAIEPSSKIYTALVENTKGLDKVETFNLAIANHTGFDNLYSNAVTDIPQSFFSNDDSKIAEQVNVIALDEFLDKNKINHVDVMKIDTEGAEYVIFPSDSFKRASKKIDFIIGESHYLSRGFPEILDQVLKESGFNFKIIESPRKNFIREFHYTDPFTGKTKGYNIDCNTMFTAEKI